MGRRFGYKKVVEEGISPKEYWVKDKEAIDKFNTVMEGYLLFDLQEIVHGDAPGEKMLVCQFCNKWRHIINNANPADWDRYGKSAGYRRNAQMLSEHSPDLVVAFPGGQGTANQVELARKNNIPVRLVE